MRPTPEYVLELARQIVTAKEELAKATRQWDALFQSSSQAPLPLPSLSGINNGARKRVLELLGSEPETAFTSERVSATLRLPTGTSRTTLSKLVRDRAIEKRGAALYGAIRATAPEEEIKEQTPTEVGV